MNYTKTLYELALAALNFARDQQKDQATQREAELRVRAKRALRQLIEIEERTERTKHEKINKVR